MSLQAISSKAPSVDLSAVTGRVNASLNKTTTAALQAITKLKEDIKDLKNENSSLTGRVTVLTADHGKQVEETHKIAQQLSVTKEELQVSTSAHSNLSTENTALKQDLKATQAKLASSETSNTSLQKDLSAAQEEIEKLKAMINTLMGDVEGNADQFAADLSKLMSTE